MKVIADMHQEIDRHSGLLADESARQGKPITCEGKGCCSCCHEPVYCSSAEVQHIVESLTDEQKEIVADRTKTCVETVTNSGMFRVEMPPVMDWLAMKLPCPFLENGICMVYESRPTSCRSHMAIRSRYYCEHLRMEQKYPVSTKISVAQGNAIFNAHIKLGNTIIIDNMLALLSNELLGEYPESASAKQAVFTEEQIKEIQKEQS